MSIFSFKKRPSFFFVFDIRDDSVTAAVAKFEKDKKPDLILCQNFKIENQNPADYQKYLASMLSTLNNAIIANRKNFIKTGNKEKIAKYFFFIGSPWSVSQSKMIKILKDRPFEITNDLLDKIVTNEESETETEIEKSSNKADWAILEEKIIQVKLNGYKVEKIFNKKTNALEAELFVSFLPNEIKNKIYSFTDKNNGGIKIEHLHSSIFSSYTFFRDLFSDKNNFISIDIGQLITDVYVVRDDTVYGVASFPFGEKNILDTIVQKANMPESVVLSAINMGCHGTCDEKTEKEMKKVMAPGINAWLEKLNVAVSKVCAEMDIPKDIFIIENSNLIKTMMKEVKKENMIKILGTKMEIESIGEGTMNNFVVNGKVFKNEPYAKMDLIFLDKIIQKNHHTAF